MSALACRAVRANRHRVAATTRSRGSGTCRFASRSAPACPPVSLSPVLCGYGMVRAVLLACSIACCDPGPAPPCVVVVLAIFVLVTIVVVQQRPVLTDATLTNLGTHRCVAAPLARSRTLLVHPHRHDGTVSVLQEYRLHPGRVLLYVLLGASPTAYGALRNALPTGARRARAFPARPFTRASC